MWGKKKKKKRSKFHFENMNKVIIPYGVGIHHVSFFSKPSTMQLSWYICFILAWLTRYIILKNYQRSSYSTFIKRLWEMALMCVPCTTLSFRSFDQLQPFVEWHLLISRSSLRNFSFSLTDADGVCLHVMRMTF